MIKAGQSTTQVFDGFTVTCTADDYLMLDCTVKDSAGTLWLTSYGTDASNSDSFEFLPTRTTFAVTATTPLSYGSQMRKTYDAFRAAYAGAGGLGYITEPLDHQGCDDMPGVMSCGMGTGGCCDDHDACYAKYFCKAGSIINSTATYDCKKCDFDAIGCIAKSVYYGFYRDSICCSQGTCGVDWFYGFTDRICTDSTGFACVNEY